MERMTASRLPAAAASRGAAAVAYSSRASSPAFVPTWREVPPPEHDEPQGCKAGVFCRREACHLPHYVPPSLADADALPSGQFSWCALHS
jgi:hypothetical protein